MSEQTNENLQQYPEQLSDVLLVMDKEKKKIQAVTGVDENGNLKTVDATKKNQSQFMRVDRAGDLFTNFFSNFWRQLKDPTLELQLKSGDNFKLPFFDFDLSIFPFD
ncbi:hypothetical protein [Sphingobacterium composti]|uniref:hypothetical protein n=1 Tax=Sphingobacterium composti TaxID=363260 RepID=UPI003D663126